MRVLILGSVKLAVAFVLIYGLLFITLVKVRLNGFGLIYRTSELILWKGGNTWSNFQDHEPAIYHDVLVIGSSHAYRGYDPRIFSRKGYSMYNLGTTAQAPVNTWPIVKRHANKGNTGLLILDVYPGIFNNRGLESAADLIPNVDDDRLALDVAWHVKDPRVLNLLMMRVAKRKHPPAYLKMDYVRNGYCSTVDSVENEIMYPDKGVFNWDQFQFSYVERIIDHCEQQAIPLVLVTHPMPLASDTLAHRHFARSLRTHLGPNGPLFLDLAVDHDLHDRHHFYDHNHLNQAGVDLFVPRLIDSLEAHGLLPRTDIP